MTPIFHITHLSNLPLIIEHGGLYCDSDRASRGLAPRGIAHQHIKDRRARRPVPVAAGGTLADYVPFYFAPRSPMLFAVQKGNVVGYTGGQESVLHLASTVELAMAVGSPWCFTDGHADMELTEFFHDWALRERVDWLVMPGRYWFDTPDKPDRKRRRQAEFLVHRFYPWTAFDRIGVQNVSVAAAVRRALTSAPHRPSVEIRPDWYY